MRDVSRSTTDVSSLCAPGSFFSASPSDPDRQPASFLFFFYYYFIFLHVYPAIYIGSCIVGRYATLTFLADHRTSTPPMMLSLIPQTLLALINPISRSAHSRSAHSRPYLPPRLALITPPIRYAAIRRSRRSHQSPKSCSLSLPLDPGIAVWKLSEYHRCRGRRRLSSQFGLVSVGIAWFWRPFFFEDLLLFFLESATVPWHVDIGIPGPSLWNPPFGMQPREAWGVGHSNRCVTPTCSWLA